ncbi:dephospho-CoA kinase [Flagellimonas algicola]|uniref:Dephospho-CoA kinase n=1 Tax=Flagellimonas algicola TaxID=2583815 RepID=A0ABY2WP85_9FLAO|nr:dephospho-CoA kinase [Allomuricauda algicola]TMU56806.1 dephospho-CoA kinase [Allomuricauda algicola]
MRIVGLTGGIGSGKSTVAEMFRALGISVYDSDVEARNLMTSSAQVKEAIVELLGEASYEDGNLNRTFVASKVFAEPVLLKALNRIVHPAVREHFAHWVTKQEGPYVIQETALIFENGMQDQYDHIILVSAPYEIRLERVMRRDQAIKEQVLERMRNQLEDDKKKDLSHFIIDNLDLENTRRQVIKLHETLANQAN